MRTKNGAMTQRTYFIKGHRVEQIRNVHGHLTWACDCAEYRRTQPLGLEPTCEHAQRVAAAASVDRLLGTRGWLMSSA